MLLPQVAMICDCDICFHEDEDEDDLEAESCGGLNRKEEEQVTL